MNYIEIGNKLIIKYNDFIDNHNLNIGDKFGGRWIECKSMNNNDLYQIIYYYKRDIITNRIIENLITKRINNNILMVAYILNEIEL
jgi:hypothetical protein